MRRCCDCRRPVAGRRGHTRPWCPWCGARLLSDQELAEKSGIEVMRAPLEDPDIWTITGFHHELVNYAARFLTQCCGCHPEEITTEYFAKVMKRGGAWTERYFVDVAALRMGKPHIAVECGAASLPKLLDLKTIFDRVIHLESGIRTPQGDTYREQVRGQHAEQLVARRPK